MNSSSRDLRATSGAPSGASIAPLTPELSVAEKSERPEYYTAPPLTDNPKPGTPEWEAFAAASRQCGDA